MDYIGQQIGKYTINRLIGEGGMASVFEGVHESLGTKTEINNLNPILSSISKLENVLRTRQGLWLR